MMIGAARLVRGWGRPATCSRGGVELWSALIRKARYHPTEDHPVNSYSENEFVFIVCAADLNGNRVQKYDSISYDGDTYTVRQAITAGAEVDELVRIIVQGGMV